MHSLALKLGPLTIYWYGIMVALGFMCAVGLMMLNRKHAEMDTEQISDMALYGMIAGIVGARIFYVCQFWSQYQNDLFQIIRIDKGGLVFYGGFICASLTVLIYTLKKKLPVLKVFDIIAPSMAIGHMFGRIGCFLNGCCFGKPSDLPWAVQFPKGSAPCDAFPGQAIHPVQLYESLFNLILAILLMFLLKRLRPGQIAATYLVCYGIGRFTIESLRGDHHQFILEKFTVSQSIGIFVAAAGIALFAYTIRKTSGQKAKND
ncbi:MAG TPA: prolipoprotein diacylglyceryl transferase [Lentisphaeria bacterium]|nr:MAG: prolipoprotein diacylglyceryl transferase [Lentisphaerae bacterium GWF2_49_21]HBC85991.1 prolipoprotein diacylglyceryl transferase [Lentisphaeria bacterium]